MRSRVLILAAAVVVGLAAAFLAGRYINAARLRVEAQARPVEVLVATKDLPQGMTAEELFSGGYVEKREIPSEFVAQGAISSSAAVEGQLLASAVSSGEQLTKARFAYASQAGLAFSVPKDYLAVSMADSAVIGVSGLVKPGDFVAVIATFEVGSGDITHAETKIIIPKARVVAVGGSLSTVESTVTVTKKSSVLSSNSKASASAEPLTITLALSPADTEKLVFADHEGGVRLALLPSGTTNVAKTAGARYGDVIK